MATPRYLYRFTSLDATTVVTMPLGRYEWQSSQELRLATAPAIGAHYAYDFQARSASPRNPARESVRTLAVEASTSDLNDEIATTRARVMRLGLGKVWTQDSGGTLHWAYARPIAAPEFTITVGQQVHAPLAFEFLRLSDWFGENQTTGSQTVSATPTNFTINNPGDLPAYAIVFRFRSSGASGFTDPTLLNTTNGYQIGSTRDAVDANSELKIDTGEHDVLWSTDNGSSYADDYSNFSIEAEQVDWMKLEPGDNSMQYSDGGTPNLDIEWSFYAPYAF